MAGQKVRDNFSSTYDIGGVLNSDCKLALVVRYLNCNVSYQVLHTNEEICVCFYINV